MTIHYTKGDLLQRKDVEAIVNTVNCVGAMGKGIALQFKLQYPDNYQAYQAACQAGEVRIGKMFIFANSSKISIPAGAIRVGRGFPLGNRFIIGVHGVRLEVIDMYRQWLRDMIIDRDPVILQALHEIQSDTSLVCYCWPSPCHAEVGYQPVRSMKSYVSYTDLKPRSLVAN